MRLINFIKTLFRNVILHRGFSLVTLIGLSLGITVGFLVLIYVYHESSYDRHLPSADNIYRFHTYGKIGADTIQSALTSVPFLDEVKDTPGIVASSRLMTGHKKVVESNYSHSLESRFFYADSAFFDVFEFSFLLGSREDAMSKTNAVIITISTSQRLFGYRNPLGEKLLLDNGVEFEVTAVTEDVPSNSHFGYDFIGNWAAVETMYEDTNDLEALEMRESWLYLNSYTYFRLGTGLDIDLICNEIAGRAEGEVNQQITRMSGDEGVHPGNVSLRFGCMPIQDIYLSSDLDHELKKGGNPLYLWTFAFIAFFILMVTAINFMNLTTAKPSRRFKEIAIRKVFVASRKDIVLQFLTESVVYAFFALIVSLVLVELSLPGFNRLFNIDMDTGSFFQRLDILWVLLITLLVGMVAGSYPAFFYSGFAPITIIQKPTRIRRVGVIIRGCLVSLQVVLAVSLLVFLLVMYGQLMHLRQGSHGFEPEQGIVLERGVAENQELQLFRDKLVSLPQVEYAGFTRVLPGEEYPTISFRDMVDTSQVVLLGVISVDYAFFDALGANLLQGRLFEQSDAGDQSKVILNESAARVLGYSLDLSNPLEMVGGRSSATIYRFEPLGVVEDILFESLRSPSRPMVFMPFDFESDAGHIIVRFSGGDYSQNKQLVLDLWNSELPDKPIEMSPLLSRVESFYSAERRFVGIALIFTILAFLLALLGMFGMAAFSVHYHQKPIRIKWLLAAPFYRVFSHVFRGYLFFVILGMVISVPVSMSFVGIWLSTFYYEFEPSVFSYIFPQVLMLLSSVCIAYFTAKVEFVNYQ